MHQHVPTNPSGASGVLVEQILVGEVVPEYVDDPLDLRSMTAHAAECESASKILGAAVSDEEG